MLKVIPAVASLLAAASIASSSWAQGYDFQIEFNFDDGDTVVDNTLGTELVGDFSGGSIFGTEYVSSSGAPLNFTYEALSGYKAEIDLIAMSGTAGFGASTYDISFDSTEGTLTGSGLLFNGFDSSIFFDSDPIGTSGTVTISPDTSGSFSIDRIALFGTLSAVPETSTMLLGSLGSAMVLLIGFKRRRQACAAA